MTGREEGISVEVAGDDRRERRSGESPRRVGKRATLGRSGVSRAARAERREGRIRGGSECDGRLRVAERPTAGGMRAGD